MNKSFDENGLQYIWDSTSIKIAEECARKYQYVMIEGWTSPHLSVHLRFGQHYATALEHYYKHRAKGDDEQTALRKVVLEALLDTWDGRTDEEPGAPWDSMDNNKTRETLIRTIVWYIDYFRDDNTTVVQTAQGPAVEYSFLLPVDNGISFSGHLDRLVEYADSIMVMDQKTTKNTISPHYFQQFQPNTQMSMYSFAGKAVYQLAVRGVIIDAAQIAVGFTRFERGITFRTDSQLAEWYNDTMYTIEHMRELTREQYFPMNPGACNNFGGCQFISVCARSPEVRKQFLIGSFEQGKGWDPAARR